jgi:anti-anti-sigma regulatory factor
VWTELTTNRCVLRLRGRLCADTVALLNGHIDRLGCRSCDDVVLDISRLDVIDRVGARLIVGLTHYVAGRGGRLSVEGAAASAAGLIASAELEMGARGAVGALLPDGRLPDPGHPGRFQAGSPD